MESKTVIESFSVAFNEEENKIPAWIIIDHVNNMLKKAGFNACFELSQQSRFNHNEKGEGTLLTGLFNDCEKVK